MDTVNSRSFSDAQPTCQMPLLGIGDERWARRRPLWRERELALSWPQDLLESFSLRMATHGMSVSRALMQCDRRYALQQLVHAQNMVDGSLRQMAKQLFRHYESGQTDVDLLR